MCVCVFHYFFIKLASDACSVIITLRQNNIGKHKLCDLSAGKSLLIFHYYIHKLL